MNIYGKAGSNGPTRRQQRRSGVGSVATSQSAANNQPNVARGFAYVAYDRLPTAAASLA